MDVQALLVVAVTAESLRIPTVLIETHHVVARLIVTEGVEASRVETGGVVAEGVVAVHVVTGGIISVVVEAGTVEAEHVVAVDVETSRVVNILRGRRLAALMDILDSVALAGPPGLHGAISDAVEGLAVEVRLENETLDGGELRAEADRLAARKLVLTALEGLDTEHALHSAIGRGEEAVEVHGEIQGVKHETLLSCEGRSSDDTHFLLLLGWVNFLCHFVHTSPFMKSVRRNNRGDPKEERPGFPISTQDSPPFSAGSSGKAEY